MKKKSFAKFFFRTFIAFTILNHMLIVGYYITISMAKKPTLISITVFQTLIFLLISLPFIWFSRKRVVNPIDNIIKDMRDYKLGIKPEKRTTMNQLDIIQNEFVELVDDLEEEKGKQTRMIASISHDIKTPLTTIIGYTERIKNADLSEEVREKYIDKIYNKSLVMKDITESFDDYLGYNIESELKQEVIFVNDLLNKVKDNFLEDLREKQIELLIIENKIHEIMKIDVSKIMRVFSNIIGNSVRYIKEEGLIKIHAKVEEGKVFFTINDTGGGVTDTVKEHIFEPLFTTDASRKIAGLGLSICKEIIVVHGGTIEAFNEDKGLSVKFSIPIYS